MSNEIEQQEKLELKAQDDAQNFLKNIDIDNPNTMVPPPPKKGEIMICQVCGKEMLPKDFSKDEKIRKREWKWHVHNNCMNYIDNLLDRSTPGLLAERSRR